MNQQETRAARGSELLKQLLAAALLIALGAAARVWPLGALGIRNPWLTFYPAIMAAAMYGGFLAGMVGTLLTCAVVIYGGPFLVARPFLRDGADWLGVAIFFLNCTVISYMAERMRLAQRRADLARSEAEAANQAKSVFLASMSHELRTPLNAILGFSNLLNDEAGLTPDQHRKVGIIHRSGKHLLNLINDVLDLSRVESGRMAVNPSAVNLWAVVNDTVEMLRPRAEEKGLQLVFLQSPAFPHCAQVDATRLQQILVNLLGNAIRYTDQGTVVLRCEKLEPAENHPASLVMEVEDTGPGIAPEDQVRIFDPFVQVGPRVHNRGAGLGLAIAKRLVELMGGHLSVESEPGQGSVFRFQIPFLPAATSEPETEAPDSGPIAGLAPGQKDQRILIVEDQEENWLLLKELMQRVGFQVRVAENGVQGVEAYQSWVPDFIWMDCRMPVMDGLEAARRIRSLEAAAGLGQRVRIVALTASVFQEERDRVLEAGMDDFLRKPFNQNELFACLTRNLGVTFLRGEPMAPAASSALSTEALAPLSQGERQHLTEALLTLDGGTISAAIALIAEAHPDLGAAFAQEAEAYAYSRILNLLRPPDDKKS